VQHSLSLIVFPERLRRKFFALEDRLFDLRHNIRTGGVVAASELAVADFPEARPHATAFQSVWCRNLRVLIRAARQARHLTAFVDVGSGKGKACFYASRHFAQVIGIEFSQELVNAARENLRRSGKRNIQFICADAAQYDLPEAPSLVFLFNPFDSQLFEQFVLHNRARIKSNKSLIAYANDIERSVLERLGFECLFRDAYRSISLWR
jgi:SAM-dependent methyltransferase